MTGDEHDEFAEERRRIIRRAETLTWGLFATAMLVAFGGSALVALLIRPRGVSYVKTWLIISAIVLLPSAIGYLIQRYRESARRARRNAGSEE